MNAPEIPDEAWDNAPMDDDDDMTCSKAQRLLEQLGYTVNRRGMIQGLNRPETNEEAMLINYLCTEWDYGFEWHPNQRHSKNEPQAP